MKISEILKIKGKSLYTVAPDTLMSQAVAIMAEHDIGSLIVMQAGNLVGMLTFREVINAINANGGVIGSGIVGQHMDSDPASGTPDTDINDVRFMMIGKHMRYLPVLQGKELVGVISFYDVAKAVLEEQGFENTMLKAYIGDWPQVGVSE